MNFRYEANSDNNEVTLIGIEGECPEELRIPTFINIENKRMKVVRLNFNSVYSNLKYRRQNGITCKVLHIPNTIENFSVAHNKYIQEIYLPNTLTQIGKDKFSHCEELKIVHLPQELRQIGDRAFQGCKKLEHIYIPSTVTEMGYACFKNCSSLTSITIPENVKEIGYDFFSGCSNLSEVIFENDSIIFYPSTFKGCKKLKKIGSHIIENGLLYNSEKTELYTFLGNENHNGIIKVPATVRELGNGFSYSTDLVSIDLSQTQISTIRCDTFTNCGNLQTVILPLTVKSINDRAFCDCIKLSEINLPNSIEYIGVACFKDCAIKEITIPNRVVEIPQTAFMDCKELSKVDIPSSVKTINSSAFENCNMIKRVVISEGFKNKLPNIFKHSDNIEFIFRFPHSNVSRVKRTGAYTHGRLRPCPYCGSDDIDTYCDGTAECNDCGGEYTYQLINF